MDRVRRMEEIRNKLRLFGKYKGARFDMVVEAGRNLQSLIWDFEKP